MMIIAIDPGLRGHIVVLDYEGQLIAHHPMPVYEAANGRNDIDAGKLYDILAPYSGNSIVFLERQFCVSKQGLSSTFKTGVNYGLIKGMLIGLNIAVCTPSAKEWQSKVLPPKKKGEDVKKLSCETAKMRYNIDLKRSKRHKKDDDGFADALNLASYGYWFVYGVIRDYSTFEVFELPKMDKQEGTRSE